MSFVLRRLLQGAALTLVIMVIAFFLFEVLGDPVRRLLPLNASEQQVERFREANGFDEPLVARLIDFMGGILTLDFGDSYTYRQPALDVFVRVLPWTLYLSAVALVIAAVGAVVLGTVSAAMEGTRTDRVLIAVMAAVASVPEFAIGLLLIILLAVQFGVLPTGGNDSIGSVLLPAVTLALPVIGRVGFFVRSAVVDIRRRQYVRVARATGLAPRVITRSHVLRAGSLEILAIGGIEITRVVVGGAIVVETVFAWPGIGALYVTAMRGYDLPLITAGLFVSSVMVVVLNLVLDALYASLDPRILVD